MTNNKQQTAVDLIYQRMSDKIVMQDVNRGLICIHISHDDFIKLAKQAKEMEKERMIGFTNKYINSELWVNCNAIESDSTVEQYYEQTYGGGEK
jgi:hypothetical protein